MICKTDIPLSKKSKEGNRMDYYQLYKREKKRMREVSLFMHNIFL